MATKKLENQVLFIGDTVDISSLRMNRTMNLVINKIRKLIAKIKGHSLIDSGMLRKIALGYSPVILCKNAFNDINMPLMKTCQDYAS